MLAYAEGLAMRLRDGMRWESSQHGGGGYWKATDPAELYTLVAASIEARECFRLYAGPDSHWSLEAESVYRNNGERQSKETGIRALGDLLAAWCTQVRAGTAELLGERAQRELAAVRTDLMGQVRQLLEDRSMHPAAPIVLCGAALEIALRGLAEARTVAVDERASMNTLTTALRGAGLLTPQDVKDLTMCAGIRNQAAHGEFDALDAIRAGLMEQATNMLLRRLAEIQDAEEDQGAGTG